MGEAYYVLYENVNNFNNCHYYNHNFTKGLTNE